MPMISVITTAYRQEKYIAQTIESIIQQSFTDWELLIGDDSPDDLTWNIIETYRKKYPEKIRTYHHAPNLGIVGNMNFLLSRISDHSGYVAFLEGDDIFHPDALLQKIKIFERFPQTVLVYNNLDFINESGEIFYTNALRKAPFYTRNEIISKKDIMRHETFYISYSTLMLRRNILEKEKILNPTHDILYSVSDWDLFFRISTKYQTYGIEKSLTLYRRHTSNVSGNNLKIFNDLEIQIQEYLTNGSINKCLFITKQSFIHLLKSVSFLEQNNKKESWRHMALAIKLDIWGNIVYKIGIGILIILPQGIRQKILKKIIKRG